MNLIKLFLIVLATATFAQKASTGESKCISYTVDPQKSYLRLYWKDGKGHILGDIENLRTYVEGKNSHLRFAMNGGMYKLDHSPLGLFIEDVITKAPINTASGKGNFYMKPNGVFYISTDGKAAVCRTDSFVNKNVRYATQSGPMLISNGAINSAFKEGSENLNIRNGVGILPDGKVVFAISKDKINFYDFAMYFKNMGCTDALYLDGFVSRMYLPEKGVYQMDGDFGVMIGVTDR